METESKVSRRSVLLVAGGVAAAGALAASPARQVIAQGAEELTGSSSGTSSISLATASYEQWLAQVGSQFSLGGGLRMQLVGVQALLSGGDRPPGLPRDRAFAAFFDPGGRATLAGDLIYTVTHAQHGPLQIFLSASPDRRTPARMLAVFN